MPVIQLVLLLFTSDVTITNSGGAMVGVANLTLPGDFAFQDLSNNSMMPEDPSVINGRRQAQINVGEVTVSIT